jgi:phosphoribosylglycinamide formyltransferase-1
MRRLYNRGMAAPNDNDPRLTKVTEICLAFPEATAEHTGSHATFKVRKRVFAYFLNDHHGDGRIAVCCKTRLGEHEDLARADPGKFYVPAYIGSKGWVAIRLDRGRVNWKEVANFVGASYHSVAPRRKVLGVRS